MESNNDKDKGTEKEAQSFFLSEIKNKENMVVPLKYLTHLHPIQVGLLGIYQGLIEDNYEILDVGCGHKALTRYIKCKKLVGVDVFPDYLTKFDVCADIKNLNKVFPDKSFDCVFCFDVIEHLYNVEGIKLMEDMERIARKKVIIFTPIKWDYNAEGVENPTFWSFGNPYNYHKSLWSATDFKAKGYYCMDTIYNEWYVLAIKTVGV